MGFQSVLASAPKSTFNTKTTVCINKSISYQLRSMVEAATCFGTTVLYLELGQSGEDLEKLLTVINAGSNIENPGGRGTINSSTTTTQRKSPNPEENSCNRGGIKLYYGPVRTQTWRGKSSQPDRSGALLQRKQMLPNQIMFTLTNQVIFRPQNITVYRLLELFILVSFYQGCVYFSNHQAQL